MMKKVLYGVAMALLATVSFGSLQSCKDDISDLANQTQYDLATLQADLNAYDAELLKKINDNTTAIGELADAAKKHATVEWVNGLVEEQKKLDKAQDDSITEINAAIKRLDGKIDTLATGIYSKYYDLKGQVEAQAKELAAVKELAKNDSVRIDELEQENEQLWQELNQLEEKISQVYNALKLQIDEIDAKLDAIIDRLDNLVTGIIIQGVESPVFGDFSLPIGIKNNILFGYIAKNDQSAPLNFPSRDKDFSAYGDPETVNPNTFEEPLAPKNGYYAPDGVSALNLGKVYLTLNPIGHNYDGEKFTLVNSQGEPLNITLTVHESDKVLEHNLGTRAEDKIAHTLYEADVELSTEAEDAEANIDAIKLNINADLKGTMKNILKDPSKRSAKDLVKAVYDLLGTRLPAYGLRYDWNANEVTGLDENGDPKFSEKAYAVLSSYDLAVATATPLGFNFLAGEGTSKKIPTIGHVDNLILNIRDNGKLNFKLNNITVGDITINLDDVEVGVSTDNVNLVIIIPHILYSDGNGGYVEKTLVLSTSDAELADAKEKGYETQKITGMESLGSSMTEGIKSALKNAGANISSQVTKEIQKQMDSIVESLNKQINGQVNDMLTSIGNDFQGAFDKLNTVVKIYDKVAGKLNNFLANPNHYLQVCAFYDTADGYGLLSTKQSDPTVFVSKGGDAITLYLTTYTGELIAPIYARALQINSKPMLKVKDNQVKNEIPVSALKEGLNTIVYQAVDYHGYTSTQTFYITVKK